MGGTQATEARTTRPEFAGASGARTLLTQSGQSAALLQEAMTQEGGVYTLVFDVIDPGVPYECQVEIRASDKGNFIRRLITLGKGASLSLSGRIFSAFLTDTTPETLPLTESVVTPGAGSEYTVTCIIERGTRGDRNLPPIYYQGSGQLAPSTSANFPIPINIGAVSVEVAVQSAATPPTTAPNVTVTFTTSSGGIFKQYSPVLESGFVSIPPGATVLEITNNDASNPLTFSITYGIDG